MDSLPIERLNKDLRSAAKLLSREEARHLVRTYYQMQKTRIISHNQLAALEKSGMQSALLPWFEEQGLSLEDRIKTSLDVYSLNHPTGKWMRSITGIGPVIAAGFLAHIDIARSEAPGNLWSFAGLSPGKTWEKGQKRPWNAQLKVLCYKAGESFVKVQNNPNDFYGKLYAQRKAKEAKLNEDGGLATQAQEALTKHKYSKDTEAYKAYSVGKLPPAHLHARARRYAAKMFLAHLWQVWREIEGLPVALPYPIAILGHAHLIPPPNWPMAQAA